LNPIHEHLFPPKTRLVFQKASVSCIGIDPLWNLITNPCHQRVQRTLRTGQLRIFKVFPAPDRILHHRTESRRLFLASELSPARHHPFFNHQKQHDCSAIDFHVVFYFHRYLHLPVNPVDLSRHQNGGVFLFTSFPHSIPIFISNRFSGHVGYAGSVSYHRRYFPCAKMSPRIQKDRFFSGGLFGGIGSNDPLCCRGSFNNSQCSSSYFFFEKVPICRPIVGTLDNRILLKSAPLNQRG